MDSMDNIECREENILQKPRENSRCGYSGVFSDRERMRKKEGRNDYGN